MIHRGIQSFCNRKQIHTLSTVKLFTKETGLNVDENFTKFASFVDRKIKSGELKGNDTPLNKEVWTQANLDRKIRYDEFNTFSKEQKQFYKKYKETLGSSLDSFFAKNNLQRPRQKEAVTKLGKLIPLFDCLEENSLLEEFLNYKYE